MLNSQGYHFDPFSVVLNPVEAFKDNVNTSEIKLIIRIKHSNRKWLTCIHLKLHFIVITLNSIYLEIKFDTQNISTTINPLQ